MDLPRTADPVDGSWLCADPTWVGPGRPGRIVAARRDDRTGRRRRETHHHDRRQPDPGRGALAPAGRRARTVTDRGLHELAQPYPRARLRRLRRAVAMV